MSDMKKKKVKQPRKFTERERRLALTLIDKAERIGEGSHMEPSEITKRIAARLAPILDKPPKAPVNKPRTIVYIDPSFYVPDRGYRVSFVFEGEGGHRPTGTWPYTGAVGEQLPWFWGHDLDAAEAACRAYNERRGISREEMFKILASSMFEGGADSLPPLRLLKFTASWCAPCKAIRPMLERFVKAHAGELDFEEVDVDGKEGGKLADLRGVLSIPTLLVVERGKRERVISELGYPFSAKDLEAWWAKVKKTGGKR